VKTHQRYTIRASDLSNNYDCSFEAIDEENICGSIPRLHRGPWMQEFAKLDVNLTDVGSSCPVIEMLIGADVAEKLLTGKLHKLSCGLVAVETVFSWTVMGKVPQLPKNPNHTLLVTSLCVSEPTLSDLWSLDSIVIRDSTESKTREELQLAAMDHFHSTVKRLENGRYEVSLPWIEGHPKLPSNFEHAKHRLR